MARINVLIADDHALVREGITAILKCCGEIEVVAEASDGIDAVQKFKTFKPDVVLMDISMPKLGGLEAVFEIKKIRHDVKILVLTQYSDKEYISRFFKAGVSGYLLKTALGGELISAIKAVSRGECYLFPTIASEIVTGYLDRDKKPVDDAYEGLTGREKQVLKLVAEGFTYKEIASELKISFKTVIAHQANLKEKLGLSARAELIKFAIRRGIIKIGPEE
ncbi:MAG: response regulator transcription factor [Nitrospiraceae bacterium]|nr:response regulator transcription factor [Nitrospiraceae bacterium]